MKATEKPLDDKTLRQLVYIRGYRDLEFFVNYFFGENYTLPFSPMHYDFFESERFPEQRNIKEVIAAPRGHAKTTFKLYMKVIHDICYNTEDFILIIGHTTQDAEERVGQILEMIENNQKLRTFFGPLLPHRKKRRYKSRKRFETANGIIVMGKSKGQSVRGLNHHSKRPSLIILDDVEALEEVRNPIQRKKLHDWFFKDVLKAGQLKDKTNVTVIGTCLHPEALLPHLLTKETWQASRYQAIISYAERQELWDEYKKRLTDLSDKNRVTTAYNYYLDHEEEMLKGARVLWPEGDPYEYLIRMKIVEGENAFNSEKQNEPYDPEHNIFDMKKALRFTFEREPGAIHRHIRWLDGSNKVVKRLKRVISYHDPAMGQEPTQKGERDYACIVVIGEDEDGYLYVLDTYLRKDLPDQQVRTAFELFNRWQFETLYYENNGSQALMGQIYKLHIERLEEKPNFRTIGIHQTENKFKRISTLEPEITNGYLLFADDLDQRFIEQISYFPSGSHDDGPDALHGAVRQFNRRPGRITQLAAPNIIN